MDQKQRCQSCGMPLGEEGFYGTNDDGSPNQDYCTFCFQKGSYTNPSLTVDQMIDSSVKFMTENLQFSEEKARELSTQVIPSLKRWESS